MKTRIRYNLLPPGAHTILPIDHQPPAFDPGLGFNAIDGWERMDLNAVAEIDDINDPKSHRAYQMRGHLYGFGSPGQYGYQGPLATLLEGPDPWPLPPPPPTVQEVAVAPTSTEMPAET